MGEGGVVDQGAVNEAGRFADVGQGEYAVYVLEFRLSSGGLLVWLVVGVDEKESRYVDGVFCRAA